MQTIAGVKKIIKFIGCCEKTHSVHEWT